jgi:hypothetical protein
MDPGDWSAVKSHDPFSEPECGPHQYWQASFWVEGDDEATEAAPLVVGVRPKRYYAIVGGGDDKISLKIDVNRYVHGQIWHFLTKLSLENGGEGVIVKEALAWQLHEAGESMASCANWVWLTVNGQQMGVYGNVEQVNRWFLKARLSEDAGHMWKLSCQDLCAGQTRDDQTGLWDGADPNCVDTTRDDLCFEPFVESSQTACAGPPQDEWATALPPLVNMEQFLHMTAVDALMSNKDALTTNHNNFYYYNYLYGEAGRVYFPWDLDTVMTPQTTGLVPGTPFAMVLDVPEFRERYRTIVQELLAGPFSEASMSARLDAVQDLIGADLAADPYMPDLLGGGLQNHIDNLKAWWQARIPQMQAEVDAL